MAWPLFRLVAALTWLVITSSSLCCNGLSLNLNNVLNGGSSKGSTTTPPPTNVKILILPGFGNDSGDYTMPGSLVDSLKGLGWATDDDKVSVSVLPVKRTDWLQVFTRGCLDWKFWLGEADPTRPAFRWYLERISEQVEELCSSSNIDDDDDNSPASVILVGHSAGGWLGRAAMGFGSDNDSSSSSPSGPPINMTNILGLVSLGAPHLPPPETVMDMTRGALKITNSRFPASYHAQRDGIFYITAIGLAVKGEQQQRQSPFEPTSVKGFAYNSYEAVCGDGTTIGDGVVPVSAAHLEGAVQLNLDGVLHSINAPENWYGSASVIERWHGSMLKELQRVQSARRDKQSSDPRTDVLAAISGLFDNFK